MQKFGRWDWVEYDYTSPGVDKRRESQKVVPESITVLSKMKPGERSRLACAMTRETINEAESRKETLTLLKPTAVTLSWRRKADVEIEDERQKHAALVNQLSMFDAAAKPTDPCPYEFSFRWLNFSGSEHRHICDDWETSTAFFRRRDRVGEEAALRSLKETYEVDYLQRGMRFALGTHSRRSAQWLLVGVLRVDEQIQQELAL